MTGSTSAVLLPGTEKDVDSGVHVRRNPMVRSMSTEAGVEIKR